MATKKTVVAADLLSLSLSAELRGMLEEGTPLMVSVAVVRDGRIDVGVTTQQFPACDLPQASEQIRTLLDRIHAGGCETHCDPRNAGATI